MFITSKKIGFGVLGLALVSGTAWSATIQGEVKGPNGKLLKGVEVRAERTDKKSAPIAVATDRAGHYIFDKLDVGTYKLQASAGGMGTTTSANINARADGAVRVDFNLKNTGSGTATKKKTHKVWIAGNTGTNLGGRWVDVPDDEVTAPAMAESASGADALGRAGNGMVRSAQQSGGGNPHGN